MNTKLKRLLIVAITAISLIFVSMLSFGGIALAEEADSSVTTESVQSANSEEDNNQGTDGDNSGTTQSTEDTGTDTGTEESTDGTEEEEAATLLSRLWEYITENYAEIISTVGAILAAAITVIVTLYNKLFKKNIDVSALNIEGKTSDVVDAVNSLIESYNTLEAKYTEVESQLAEYNEAENDKYVAVGSMVTQTKAILEILATVYANSKNLPQGVKDLVSLKYATALKTTSDETAVTEVAEEAIQEAKEEETETTEETAEG